MQQSDFERFRAVMACMGKLYEREIDGVLMDAYWLALHDWTLPNFEQAAAHLMANNTFMPRPSDFNALRKAARPTVGEAWNKAVSASGSSYTPQGYTGRGTCGDELIDRAVAAIGGFGAIATCDTDKLHFLERRFAEIYEPMEGAEDVRDALPKIAGPSQVTRLNGPKKVGDLLSHLKRPE